MCSVLRAAGMQPEPRSVFVIIVLNAVLIHYFVLAMYEIAGIKVMWHFQPTKVNLQECFHLARLLIRCCCFFPFSMQDFNDTSTQGLSTPTYVTVKRIVNCIVAFFLSETFVVVCRQARNLSQGYLNFLRL